MNYRKKNFGSRNKNRKPKQWKKPKTPPEPAKPSVVRFLPLDKLMNWNERDKRLFLDGDGHHHVFPAKNKAQSAIWKSVQKSGFPKSHTDYRVEDA